MIGGFLETLWRQKKIIICFAAPVAAAAATVSSVKTIINPRVRDQSEEEFDAARRINVPGSSSRARRTAPQQPVFIDHRCHTETRSLAEG